MMRAALFTFVGVVLCARSLQSFAGPDFEDPVSASDWFAVLSVSAGLFALAFAIALFAQLIGSRAVYRISRVAAVGAGLSALSNLLEDALQLGFAFWFFIVGTALTMAGLIAFTVVVAVVGRGPRRLLAAVPAATMVGLLLLESGGGVLILAGWLAAAAIVLRRSTPTAAQIAPAAP